jgi:hypothetical protein
MAKYGVSASQAVKLYERLVDPDCKKILFDVATD